MKLVSSPAGYLLIQREEGCVLHRYADVVGVETIGFGTTSSVIHPLPAVCTYAQAAAWLKLYVDRECIPALESLGTYLNPNQVGAMCSFLYNEGAGAVEWQIGRDIRAGNFEAVANDFGRYAMAGGRILSDLVARRQHERELFLTPWVEPLPADPYARFDLALRRLPHQLSSTSVSEKWAVMQYDHLSAHRHMYEHRLERLKLILVFFRKRAWYIAHFNPETGRRRPKPVWDESHLGWRWQQLNKRTA